MNQFPSRSLFEAEPHEDQQNTPILKVSSKSNMQFSRGLKPQRQSLKQSSSDIQLLQKTIKSNQEMIAKQKTQIDQLKRQIEENRQYTTSLEQKYTVLLESVQPFQEKVNVQKLVDKISFLQNQYQALKKATNDTTSFKFLKLTQKSTSIQSNELRSTNFDQLSQISEKCIQSTISSGSPQNSNKPLSKAQEKETEINTIDRRNSKIRKQSLDSDYGVQVCISNDYNAPIKKHNIERFISLESQMKNHEVNLSRKRKNSQFEENLSAVWQKLINQYLANDQGHGTKFKYKTQHLLKKCIPYQLRSTVWPMIFENPLGITWQFYMQLLERREKGWVEESVKIQIQKDLKRSFSGKGRQIENKDKLIDQVQQVLELFHLYRPDVSYVQGMTYPAIVLTTVVGKMRALCILANQIVGIPFFKRLYTFDGNYPSIYCRTFDFLLKDVNSGAYEMLQKKHVCSEIFLVEWFYTFFSRGLSFETTLKIWDHMAYFGQVTIFKVAVTVIELVVGYLNDTTYEGALGLIKEFSSYIDDKKLIDAFNNSKVTEDRYKKAFKKAIKSFQS